MLALDRRPSPDDLRPPDRAVYTAMRLAPDGRIPALDLHFERLWSSASALGWSPTCARADLRVALRRVAPTRAGAGAALLLDLHPDGGGVLAHWPLPEPSAHGARLARALPGAARAQPAAKDSAWRANRRAWERDAAADDHLLEGPDGALIEGFTSTLFFARGGRVTTHGAGSLPGITRRLLAAPFAALGLELVDETTRWRDLAATAEVGMASALRGLRPVVQVGEHRVADGRPGPIMTAAHQALERILRDSGRAP